MKSLICLFLFSMFLTLNTALFSTCQMSKASTELASQSTLTPLDILILDIRDVTNLIEEGDNKTAIDELIEAGLAVPEDFE